MSEPPQLTPAPDAGTARVSIRRVLPSGAPSDVVGHLIAANDEWLVVLPEDRGAVWVPRVQAASIRRIPERTVLPASDGEGLERVLDRTWPGTHRARLGGWVLRRGHGVTRRANSVLAVGDAEAPFGDALVAVEAWYEGAATLQAVEGSATQRAAAGHGLVAVDPTLVLTRRLREPPGGPGAATLVQSPDEAWTAVAGAGVDRVAELTSAPASYLRLGESVGRVALLGHWAVLSCITVAPGARGRGLGRSMTEALLREGQSRGARYAALQVEDANEAAKGLYLSMGFEEHHRYAYWARP